jgi:prepilin-type N-terminal cleavage/methylation domain-containing protein
MKFRKLSSQNGFTLVELLVAIAIGSIIMAGIAITVYQMFVVQASTTNRMYAVRQVQNVGYWVSRDAQSAQIISFDDEETAGVNEFLVFSRIGWDGIEYETRYIIYASGDMYRYEYEDDVETGEMLVAQDIKAEETGCELDTGKLTMTVTAEVGGFGRSSETRIYEVVPRSVL